MHIYDYQCSVSYCSHTGIYAEHGRSCISHVCNEQELTSGAVELQVSMIHSLLFKAAGFETRCIYID